MPNYIPCCCEICIKQDRCTNKCPMPLWDVVCGNGYYFCIHAQNYKDAVVNSIKYFQQTTHEDDFFEISNIIPTFTSATAEKLAPIDCKTFYCFIELKNNELILHNIENTEEINEWLERWRKDIKQQQSEIDYSYIPPLNENCNTWTISSKHTGKSVGRFTDIEDVKTFNPNDYLVENTNDYISRMNRQIAEANPSMKVNKCNM